MADAGGHPQDGFRWFSGESTAVTSTATMHCLGGHFRGSSILHVQDAAPGSSFICTGDTIMVSPFCFVDRSILLLVALNCWEHQAVVCCAPSRQMSPALQLLQPNLLMKLWLLIN